MPALSLSALESWLGMTPGQDSARLEWARAAADAYANSLPHIDALTVTDTDDYTPDAQLAVLILAARDYRRRNTPSGVESFADAGGIAYVARTDPDIARGLRIGPYAYPRTS